MRSTTLKHRTLAAALAVIAIATSQLLSTGAALAVGSANGGVWKTTDGGAQTAGRTLTAQAEGPSPLLVPAVQAVRCASSC